MPLSCTKKTFSLRIFPVPISMHGVEAGVEIFSGIINQILHHFHQTDSIAIDHRQIILDFDLGMFGFQLTTNAFDCSL